MSLFLLPPIFSLSPLSSLLSAFCNVIIALCLHVVLNRCALAKKDKREREREKTEGYIHRERKREREKERKRERERRELEREESERESEQHTISRKHVCVRARVYR
jgi:hypothetical protein